ncbi:MAG: hypothetical protein KF851_06585 [Pirellulaceae bacterium]|jgi:hypothetical protein|nr:hypothetical protein [Pirellulaceae bacterium]
MVSCDNRIEQKDGRLQRWVFLLMLCVCVLPGTVGYAWQDLPAGFSAEGTVPAPFDQSSELPRFFAGYDRGFVIANHGQDQPATAEFPFLMRVNSWLQLRNTIFDSTTLNNDLRLNSFERLRLQFSGHVFTPGLGYFFQLDGNSDQANEATFLDYYVTYQIGEDRFGWEEGAFGIKAGKWKVPFSRSREESGRRFQFTERSTTNLFFDVNRSIGVGMFGRIEKLAAPVLWEAALFNGFATGAETNIVDSDLDQNFAWSARIATDLFSEFGNDGEPDLSWHTLPALRLGAGIAGTRIDAQGAREFQHQRVVDSGQRLSDLLLLLPDPINSYDVGLFTVDAHGKYLGNAIIYEYYWRYIGNFQGADVPNLLDHGFNLQFGRFVVREKLELLGRWSRIVGNSGTLGLEYQSTDEVGAGFAWYLRGHNTKLVFDFARINGMPLNSRRLDVLPGDSGWLMRTQFQLAF